jgi:hypothetical protein
MASLQQHIHPGDGFSRTSRAFELLLEYMHGLPPSSSSPSIPSKVRVYSV